MMIQIVSSSKPLRPTPRMISKPVIITVDHSIPRDDKIAKWKTTYVEVPGLRVDFSSLHFSSKKRGLETFEARLFRFNHETSSLEAKQLIEKKGWQAAGIEHLLTYGITHPEKKFIAPLSIACVISSGTGYICLEVQHSKRLVHSVQYDYHWSKNCYFLAVRKIRNKRKKKTGT